MPELSVNLLSRAPPEPTASINSTVTLAAFSTSPSTLTIKRKVTALGTPNRCSCAPHTQTWPSNSTTVCSRRHVSMQHLVPGRKLNCNNQDKGLAWQWHG